MGITLSDNRRNRISLRSNSCQNFDKHKLSSFLYSEGKRHKVTK